MLSVRKAKSHRRGSRSRLAAITAARSLVAIALIQLGAASAGANTYYFDTASGLWQTGSDWSTSATGSPAGGTVPVSTDSVIFSGTTAPGNVPTTATLNAATSITGITVNNTSTTRSAAAVAPLRHSR